MGKELAIKGKWKRKWKYRSESLLIFLLSSVCSFFLFSVCLFFISYLVSCMARYLFMSLCGVFDLSYPKMSRISDVGVISYFA
jgi:hypothetical protein